MRMSAPEVSLYVLCQTYVNATCNPMWMRFILVRCVRESSDFGAVTLRMRRIALECCITIGYGTMQKEINLNMFRTHNGKLTLYRQ